MSNASFIIAFLLVAGVIALIIYMFVFVGKHASREKPYKATAYELLKQDTPDIKMVDKIIDGLSILPDEESKELVRRLISKKTGQGKP